MRLYRKFSAYLKEKFGCRVHRLCLNAHFSCPNRDGTIGSGGCLFCDNRAFSLTQTMAGDLREQIIRGQEYAIKRYRASRFLAYFQPYTNTYAPVERLREKYDIIREFPDIVGLAVGTRPDCLDEEKLDLLASYTDRYEVWLELGLPSIHDRTLRLVNRNHTYGQFLETFALARKKPLKIAVHVMLGLPGEGEKEIMETARECGRLAVDGIKIHPLYIVRGTPLEVQADRLGVRLLELTGYACLAGKFLEYLHPETVVMRLTGECRGELLVGPSWVNQKSQVLRAIEAWLVAHQTFQGKMFSFNYEKGQR